MHVRGSTRVKGLLLAGCIVVLLTVQPAFAQSADASAAEASAKKSNCLMCHAVDAKKAGPSFKETAAKYKGKADAEQALFARLALSARAKSGKEETHVPFKSNNDAEVRNVIKWILSR